MLDDSISNDIASIFNGLGTEEAIFVINNNEVKVRCITSSEYLPAELEIREVSGTDEMIFIIKDSVELNKGIEVKVRNKSYRVKEPLSDVGSLGIQNVHLGVA